MIDKLIKQYKELQDAIKSLTEEKRNLESEILSIVPYNPDGQKTIETMEYKVKVTAGKTYKVDSSVVLAHRYDFPDGMYPVREKVSYEVDAKVYRQLAMYPELREIADKFVIEVPKSIRIEVL